MTQMMMAALGGTSAASSAQRLRIDGAQGGGLCDRRERSSQ